MQKFSKIASLSLVLLCMNATAENQPVYESAAGSAAQDRNAQDVDNTGINKRDREGLNPTPQNQKDVDSDRNLLAAVRQTIVEDESLSTNAHNVKILVRDSVVTLRGPVKDAGEKARIESLAEGVAGVSSIDNQLDIKTH